MLYQSEDGQTKIDVRLDEKTVWLARVQMVALFQTTKQNISLHIKNIYKEGKLDKISTVRDYLTVQTEGKHEVRRNLIIDIENAKEIQEFEEGLKKLKQKKREMILPRLVAASRRY